MSQLGSTVPDAPGRFLDPDRLVRTFVILLAIFLVFYFSELAQFSLSIDEETAIFRTDPTIWVTQDRWVIYLIERYILTAPVVPFFPIFIFGALVSAGYMVLVPHHQYRPEDWRVLLLFILFSGFPTFYFMLDFSMSTAQIGFGLLLSCGAVALFDRALDELAAPASRLGRAVRLLALQALVVTVTLGIYQSLILLVAAGCAGVFLLRYLRGPGLTVRQILLAHGLLLCTLIAGLLLAALVSRGFQWALAAQPDYLSNFVRTERVLDEPLRVARKFIDQVTAIYGGSPSVYGYHYITLPALMLLGMFALAARAKQHGARSVFLVILYLLGIALVPFALNPVFGGRAHFRILIAVPYVVWFFAAGAMLSPFQLVRRIAVALVVIVSLQCLYTFTHFQAQKRLVLDHDKLLASEIYQRIVDVIPDFDRSRPYKVDFYGAHEFQEPYREIRGSTLSASFFEWDEGNPYRIVYFMRLLGYVNLQPIGGAEQKPLLAAMREMPIWPAQGSVRVVGDTVLVRLGKEPGQVHQDLMQQP